MIQNRVKQQILLFEELEPTKFGTHKTQNLHHVSVNEHVIFSRCILSQHIDWEGSKIKKK